MTSEVPLPRFQLEEDLAAMVDGIRTDTTAGPIGLARRGVDVVLRLTEKAHYERPLHIWIEINGLARALLEARPDCMPLANLASATVEPLPKLYGRGKDEGARMRADLRSRTLEWFDALETRAARIEAQRDQLRIVPGPLAVAGAYAISGDSVYLPRGTAWPVAQEGMRRYAVGGPEVFVPPNYEFPSGDLKQIPLDTFDGVLTGDGDGPVSTDAVRTAIGSLRFATSLL